MAKTVILLRRDPDSLTPVEKKVLKDKFGADVQYIRTDPTDYRENLADCKRLNPVFVLLPRERPIPSAAMDEGFDHGVILPDGSLGKLKPLVPEFIRL